MTKKTHTNLTHPSAQCHLFFPLNLYHRYNFFFCLNFKKVEGISVRTERILVQGKAALHSIAWITLGNCDAVFKPDLFTVWLVNFVGDLNAFLFWTFWLKTDVFNVALKQCSYCIGTASVSDRQALIFSLICFV